MKTFKDLRINARLSEEELARKLGVKKTTIKKYEASHRVPSDKKIKLLKSILNCSDEEFNEAYMNHKMIRIKKKN